MMVEGRSAARYAWVGRLRWQLLACVGVAALSMAWSAELEYDPWTWLVWARESAHWDLVTSGGPAWKPLPVAVDALLVPLGSAAPTAWSFLVRVAGLVTLVAAGRLAALLAGPRALAAALAVVGTALSSQLLLGLVPLGYSEPVLAALLLFAGEAVVRRRPTTAVGLLLAASLVRPETWPLLILAAAWLLRRRRSAWPAVVAGPVAGLVTGLVGLALAWYLPDYLSSGEFARSTRRAAIPTEGGALLGPHPALTVVLQALRTPAPPWVTAFGATVLALLARAWPPGRRRALAVIAAATTAWALVVVGLVAAGGSSGDTRYLIGWTVGVPVVGAVGAAEALCALVARFQRHRLPRPLAIGLTACLAVGSAGACVPRLQGLQHDLAGVRAHSNSYRALYATVRAAGGPSAVRACGTGKSIGIGALVGTEPHHVPVLAWKLDVHFNQVATHAVVPGTTFALSATPGPLPPPPPGPPTAAAPPWQAWRMCR